MKITLLSYLRVAHSTPYCQGLDKPCSWINHLTIRIYKFTGDGSKGQVAHVALCKTERLEKDKAAFAHIQSTRAFVPGTHSTKMQPQHRLCGN